MRVPRSLSVLAIFLSGMLFYQIPSCTHDDIADLAIDPIGYEYGDDEVSVTDGWNFDKTHSNVTWETAYLGSAALLTGRFNSFAVELEFVENEPEAISIVGSVVLSSVNTGEPGRDAGCLLNTFDVETKDAAIFTSREVSLDGRGGYLVVGDLDFHGIVDEVSMKLTYLGSTHFDESSGLRGTPFTVAGFSGTFEFNAKSVFGIQSDNVSDRIAVTINAQFKKSG